MNWDDLKLFLAIARRKKLTSAAADVKMDTTTVSRRIKRLEDNLGQTLFERLRSGHELTTHGEALFVLAEQIEANFDSINKTKDSTTHTPSGTIRISVAEGFGAEILAPLLGKFTARYPDIEIDLVSGSGFLSLSKREADIAIGLTRSKSKHIQSELLSTYNLHIYGHRNYLQNHDEIESRKDLKNHTLIDYVDDLIYSDELRYFELHLPNVRPQIRSTSILAQRQLVESGAGLAILPDFMARTDLQKVLPQKIQIKRQFWFSCHQSVAPLAKVKVFKAFAFDNLSGP
jgi:DNA-binding transcriptional LysR family regulator